MITINLNCQIDEELAAMLNEVAEGVDNIEADIMSLKDKLEGMELPLEAEEALQKVISRVSSVKDIVQ